MRRIALVLLLAAGCASTPRTDVRQAMADWMTAAERARRNAHRRSVRRGCDGVLSGGEGGARRHAEVFRQYVAASKKKTNIMPEDLRVQQHGDVAIVVFNVHNPSAVSRRTFVRRRDARGWRIVHMHASNTPNRQ